MQTIYACRSFNTSCWSNKCKWKSLNAGTCLSYGGGEPIRTILGNNQWRERRSSDWGAAGGEGEQQGGRETDDRGRERAGGEFKSSAKLQRCSRSSYATVALAYSPAHHYWHPFIFCIFSKMSSDINGNVPNLYNQDFFIGVSKMI